MPFVFLYFTNTKHKKTNLTPAQVYGLEQIICLTPPTLLQAKEPYQNSSY